MCYKYCVLHLNLQLNLYISVSAMSMFSSVVRLSMQHSFPESFLCEFLVQYFENLTALEYMNFSHVLCISFDVFYTAAPCRG